jgi:guanyl-specific ribonuclease Sa
MPRFLILGIAISLLFFPLFSPCSAMAFTVQEERAAVQKGAPSKAPPKAAPANTSSQSQAKASSQSPAKTSSQSQAKTPSQSSPSVHREVVNIVVDKIEGGAMYAKDGKKFEITSATRIVDNNHHSTRMRTAELSFENGDLVTVILK